MDHFLPIFAGLGVGALAGLLGGLLGIGGGVVIVPALILLLEQISQQPPGAITLIAVATSLSCVLGTSLAAARAQIRAGNVQWPVVQ
ncbi:MAG: TSUP family transporter, partial [Pseudomonadales bacterium]